MAEQVPNTHQKQMLGQRILWASTGMDRPHNALHPVFCNIAAQSRDLDRGLPAPPQPSFLLLKQAPNVHTSAVCVYVLTAACHQNMTQEFHTLSMNVWDELTCFLQVFNPGKAGVMPIFLIPKDMGIAGSGEGELGHSPRGLTITL